jgi:hypothetical protein
MQRSKNFDHFVIELRKIFIENKKNNEYRKLLVEMKKLNFGVITD